MNIQKINWKVFLNPESNTVSTHALFHIFNDWIPESEEIFVDVADYDHCHGGVKVILAGHYTHYYWDETENILGFMYSRIRPFPESEKATITASYNAFKKRLDQFLKDERLGDGVSFTPNKIQFTINDRAAAPNTSETFDKVSPLLKKEVESIVGGEVELEHLVDPKKLFRVNITSSKSFI